MVCIHPSLCHAPPPSLADWTRTQDGSDSLPPNNLELGLRNSFWTWVYPQHADLEFGAVSFYHVIENGLERKKKKVGQTHQEGKQWKLPGLQLQALPETRPHSCDIAVLILEIVFSLSAHGPWGDMYCVQLKIPSTGGDGALGHSSF